MKQTILGSGGGIGAPLAKELKNYTKDIRLVSRHPKKVNDGDELFQADLNDLSQIDKAIAGSEVVYVTVGFDYNIKVWKNTWPPFMKEVIASCIRHHSKLVFFDNVYMYDKKEIPAMTESSAINPPSEKGKVRRDLREMVIRAAEEKKLNALIARSADFYGPANRNSALTLMVADNLLKGKKAQVFGNPDKIHSFTFTPDAAKATAILGNTPDAFNQEWHVLTSKERLTTRQWIELIAKEINTEAGIQKVPALMVKLLGLFVPVMREFPEMLYQYEQDYFFDSSKFEKHFCLSATSPAEGVRQLVDSLKTAQ
jgi:nucleoside-diphosphate-sugar epimerase